MKKIPVAVFASGRGSNFDVLVKYPAQHYEIVCLVSDQPEAGAIRLAYQQKIPCYVVHIPKQQAGKEETEKQIVAFLQFMQVKLIALAGYMRLIGNPLLEGYGGRMINIHPSLLPNHPGLHAIEKSFSTKQGTGVSIHWVDSGMDTGTLIQQETVPVVEQDTLETFELRIHSVEHRLYPEVLDKIAASFPS
jgi:phosphoribosylglycinamide formyltransferase-1